MRAPSPRRDQRGIGLGLLLLICAGYTKQLAAISAVAALAWMFLRAPLRAIRWTLGFAAVGIARVSLAEYRLPVVNGGRKPSSPMSTTSSSEQALGLFILWFKLHGLLLVPAALLVVYELYFDRLSIYGVWIVFAGLFGGIAAGAWGAGDSYFVTSDRGRYASSVACSSRAFLRREWRMPGLFGEVGAGAKSAAPGLIIVPLLYLGYARRHAQDAARWRL